MNCCRWSVRGAWVCSVTSVPVTMSTPALVPHSGWAMYVLRAMPQQHTDAQSCLTAVSASSHSSLPVFYRTVLFADHVRGEGNKFCHFRLNLLNCLTFDLEFLLIFRSWPQLAGDWSQSVDGSFSCLSYTQMSLCFVWSRNCILALYKTKVPINL